MTIDTTMVFGSTDLRNTFPRFTPENRKTKQACGGSAQRHRKAEGCDTRINRARLAARTETVDRSNPGYTEPDASGRKPQSS